MRKPGCFPSPCRAVLVAPGWGSFGERNWEKSPSLPPACTFPFCVPSCPRCSGSCWDRSFCLGCFPFQIAGGDFPFEVLWEITLWISTGKFRVHFSLLKNCPEFLTTATTTNYFYLTFFAFFVAHSYSHTTEKQSCFTPDKHWCQHRKALCWK